MKTFGVRVAMSLQLAEQGDVAIHASLISALVASVDASIETSLVTGANTSGNVLGILNTSGIGSETYTDTTGTVIGLWPHVENAITSVETARSGHSVCVLHPRRLAFLRSGSVTEPVAGFGWARPTLAGAVASVFGGTINIVSDASIPQNLGVGTDEDVIVLMRDTESLDLMVGPARIQVGDLPSGNSLEVFINVWKDVAFSAGGLPGSLSVVGGTGCARSAEPSTKASRIWATVGVTPSAG